MPRQKLSMPLRPFNVSLPKSQYDELAHRSERFAEVGKKVTVTDLIVRAVHRYLDSEPWFKESF